MHKFAPVIGITVATFFLYQASSQMANLSPPMSAEASSKTSADVRSTLSRTDKKPSEPAYKLLIRCLSDLDDILDSIVNPATFATVRPLMLNRVRQHVAQVAEYPQGMGKLSKAASQELQQAMNRHTASMIRANNVAPGVTKFFESEVASVLNPK